MRAYDLIRFSAGIFIAGGKGITIYMRVLQNQMTALFDHASNIYRRELRKFGRMRRQYLKEHRSGVYPGLLLTGKLKEHLLAVQEQVEQIAAAEGVTEQLKAVDQMLWVRKLNGIRARAEEVVREKIMYS